MKINIFYDKDKNLIGYRIYPLIEEEAIEITEEEFIELKKKIGHEE